MINNLYLFTGENHYELSVELKRRKDNFAQKFWADTIFVYNNENRDSAAIRQSIFGGGLFVSKKLIIVEGIPQDNEASNKLKADQYEKVTEEIMTNAAWIPDDTILICVSYAPDKRGRFYKFITKEWQVKEFKTISWSALLSFIKQLAPELQLNDTNLRALVQKVGPNQFRLASEVEKLRYWKERNPEVVFTPDLIDDLCFWMVEADSFKFFDHLFSNPHKACEIIEDMQQEGSDWNQVNWLLYWGLRNYLIVLDLYQHGVRDSKGLASEGKMPPFTASNLLKNISSLQEKSSYLANFFKQLISIEYDIKMGIMPAEYFWLAVKQQVLQQ